MKSEQTIQSRRIWKYYSDWGLEQFSCTRCRWAGTVSATDLGDFSSVAATIECPKCYLSLGVVAFPNLRDTEEAAAQGNEEAIKALPGFQQRIRHNQDLVKRFAQEKIQNVDQLPELEGKALSFVWDFVKGADDEFYQVIKLGDAELWTELAFFNNIRRFNEVKELLREKYGARFQSLTPTAASIEWLTGDNLGKAMALTYT